MTGIRGKYYDGKTSRAVESVLSVGEDGTVRVGEAPDSRPITSAHLDRVRVSPRLADTPRYFYFPDGGKFETTDNAAVDRLADRFKKGSRLGLVHLLESRLHYVLISLAILVVFIWGTMTYGVPMLSKTIAVTLPSKVAAYVGTRSMAFLDNSFLSPSKLPESRRQKLLDHFTPVLEAHGHHAVKVYFRNGGRFGPNALALPNGAIIFTDEMVKLAKHDDELTAVLLHETGHVVHHHGMRTLIQDSLLGFLLLAITGDVAGSSELFMGIPVFLTEMAYSRGFEREADQYALDGLRQAGIPPVRFADLMERVARETEEMQEPSGNNWMNYLSSHPDMAERLRPFRDAPP